MRVKPSRSLRLSETLPRELHEGRQVATHLAPVEPDASVLARAEDELAVRAEGHRGKEVRIAAEVEERTLGAGLPEDRAGRSPRHDPPAVRAEGTPRHGAEVTDQQVQQPSGPHIPGRDVALEARHQQAAAVRAEDHVRETDLGYTED